MPKSKDLRCQGLGMIRRRAGAEKRSARHFGQCLFHHLAYHLSVRPAGNLGHDDFHDLSLVLGAGGLDFLHDLFDKFFQLGRCQGLGKVGEEDLELRLFLLHQILASTLGKKADGLPSLLDERGDRLGDFGVRELFLLPADFALLGLGPKQTQGGQPSLIPSLQRLVVIVTDFFFERHVVD